MWFGSPQAEIQVQACRPPFRKLSRAVSYSFGAERLNPPCCSEGPLFLLAGCHLKAISSFRRALHSPAHGTSVHLPSQQQAQVLPLHL